MPFFQHGEAAVCRCIAEKLKSRAEVVGDEFRVSFRHLSAPAMPRELAGASAIFLHSKNQTQP